jgi:hypothetical protein
VDEASSYGRSPRSSGVQVLPSVDHPDRLNVTVVLAFFVHQIQLNGSVERSRRIQQTDFVRSSGAGVSRMLRNLCLDGWLVLDVHGGVSNGNVYVLGPKFDEPSMRDRWIKVCDFMYGDDGLLRNWLGSPLLAHGSLNCGGLLYFEYVRRFEGMVRTSDIQRFFAGIASAKTTEKQLAKLRELGLIESRDNRHFLTENYENAFAAVGEEFHERADRIRMSVDRERSNFLEANGVSKSLQRLRSLYRGSPCIRCGSPSNQVEHFPPKSWATTILDDDSSRAAPGNDDWFLTYPICGGCNNQTAAFIRHAGVPQRLTVNAFRFVGGDAIQGLVTRLASLRDQFYRAFEDSDVDRAKRCAAKALAQFEAVRGKRGAIAYQMSPGKFMTIGPDSAALQFGYPLSQQGKRVLQGEKPAPTIETTTMRFREIPQTRRVE